MIAARMAGLRTESAFEVLARARQLEAAGRDVIHLEIGQPDFPTPPNVVEAGVRALRDGHTGYTPVAGIPAAREAVAEAHARARDLACDPDEVVITPGAKPILCFAALAVVEPGDEVLLPDPGFPIYRSVVELAGGVPRTYGMPAHGIDLDELAGALTERTRMVILNSPGNPTGGVIGRGQLEQLAELLAAHPRALVLSDEVYAGLWLDEPVPSIASLPGMAERTIVVDGLSKTYAMTGWRVGWGVMPSELARAVELLAVNSVSCAAAFSQHALVEALRGDQAPVEAMRAELRRRRELVVQRLSAVPGIDCPSPGGAFYAFPHVAATGLDGDALADRLLEEAGVACLAGSGFGAGGRDHVRLSFATGRDELDEALRRIERFVTTLLAATPPSTPA